MPPKKKEGRPERDESWRSPAVVIALIGALATLIGALIPLIRPHSEGPSAAPARRPPPVSIQARTAGVMPLSLKNSVSRNSPVQWFRIQAKNDSRERLQLQVRFKVGSGPVIGLPDDTYHFSVAPKSAIEERPIPRFEFSTFDKEDTLTVHWAILTEDDVRIDGRSESTKLLPRKEIKWDLKNVDGRPLPPEFYLAWLSAWVKNAKKVARQNQLEPRVARTASTTPASYAGLVVELAYKDLFAGSAPIAVERIPIQVPGAGTQEIASAENILKRRRADPLEAALLLAGVVDDLLAKMSVDLVLGAVPAKDSTAGKILLLGWRSERNWRAIEIGRASEWEFARNEAASTPKLAELSNSSSEIEASIEKQGVYLRQDTWLLSFRRAADYFGIEGIP